jgi:hypothetical protein
MRRFLVLIFSTFLISPLLASPVLATSSSAPYYKPLVTKIVSKKTSSKLASITIYAKRNNPTQNGVSPSPKIKVSIGKKSCTISVSYGACTISKIPLNSVVSVNAYQYNKYGTSDKISKKVKASSNTKVFYQVKASSRTIRSKGKVLATSSQKLDNVQAFNKSPSSRSFRILGVLSAVNEQTILNLDDPNQVVFDMSDAVALAKPTSSDGSSGFYKIEIDGSQSDPLINGDIRVSNFYIPPDDSVYATLSEKQPLVTGGVPCLLVKINASSGVPTCVDNTLSEIKWPYEEPGINTDGILPPPIQFDRSGRIYYLGKNGSGNTVLRRVSGGTPTDLINQNIEVNSFYVTPNADVIHCGGTSSSSSRWIRKLSTTGRLSTLKAKGNCQFMQKFSDGNLWIGSWTTGTLGVLRYSLTENKLLTSPFGNTGSDYGLGIPDIDLQKYSDEFRINDSNFGFYGYSGASLVDSFTFPSTRQSWVLAGWPGTTDLVRYTPSLMIAETSISNYVMGRRVLNTLILTGTDRSDTNRLILYDSQSGNETVIFDKTNEIEIYDMVFVAGTNKLLFSGLRFSDNTYVVGEVSL